jgi:hypothetical protein
MRKLAVLIPMLVSSCMIDGRGEDEFCRVHQQAMAEDTVNVIYGLPYFTEGYLQAMTKKFPNANVVYYGGCVIGCCSPSQARVRYCAECRRAEKTWVGQRP